MADKDFYQNPTLPIYGSGDFVILAHSNGIRSYYFHLETNSINGRLREVKQDKKLAMVGSSGHSSGAHLHFVVEDTISATIINPFQILPKTLDRSKPRIASVLAVIKEKIYKLKNKSTFRYKGRMKLFVIAWDLKPGYPPRTPISGFTACGVKRVTLLIDGEILRDYDFSSLKRTQAGLVLFPQYNFAQTYGRPFNFHFGEFVPTSSHHLFEALCEDWAGNTHKVRYNVYFR